VVTTSTSTQVVTIPADALVERTIASDGTPVLTLWADRSDPQPLLVIRSGPGAPADQRDLMAALAQESDYAADDYAELARRAGDF